MKILVVDDNKDDRLMLRKLLEGNGYEAIKAETGEEGVRLAIKERPDLILMDVKLPDIDGLEATKRIRKSEADGNIPIIALTSYAMAGDRERFLVGGFTAYIEKPIDPYKITSEIEKHV